MESTNEHGEPLAGEIEDGRQPTIEEIDMMDADNDTRSVPGSYAESNLSVEGSGAGTPSVKRRRGGSQVSETSAILREFLAERPKPSDFMQQKPIDDLQHFFDSMASTVRNFSLIAAPSIVGLPIAFANGIRFCVGIMIFSVLSNIDSHGLGIFSARIRLCKIQDARMILSVFSGVVKIGVKKIRKFDDIIPNTFSVVLLARQCR